MCLVFVFVSSSHLERATKEVEISFVWLGPSSQLKHLTASRILIFILLGFFGTLELWNIGTVFLLEDCPTLIQYFFLYPIVFYFVMNRNYLIDMTKNLFKKRNIKKSENKIVILKLLEKCFSVN